MRHVYLLGVVLVCAACAPTSELERESREYQRIDYFESVFLPVSRACYRAGGFMIFEDTARAPARYDNLSYSDMRMAVMRGCAGI